MMTDDTAVPRGGSTGATPGGTATGPGPAPRAGGTEAAGTEAAGTDAAGAGPAPFGGTEPPPSPALPPAPPPALPLRAAFGLGDLRAAATVALGVAVLGAPVGAIWSAVGPHASVVVTGEGAAIADHRQEAFIGADATFAGIAVVTGLLLGTAVYLWRRRRGPWMAIGLAAGALAGSALAAYVGHHIGLSAYRELLARDPGGPPFDRPVKLDATGALFLQPLVAVIIYVLAAGWSRFADLGRVAPEPAEADHAADGTAAPVSSGSAGSAARPGAPVPPPAGGASSPPA